MRLSDKERARIRTAMELVALKRDIRVEKEERLREELHAERIRSCGLERAMELRRREEAIERIRSGNY